MGMGHGREWVLQSTHRDYSIFCRQGNGILLIFFFFSDLVNFFSWRVISIYTLLWLLDFFSFPFFFCL